ncbi:hypothetical protein PIB30_097534 [Stylosanthes scabra]|uniref:Uncharacterized protein n=1 Tax=Stylosanthes scabra TaxID=79078 RepID=A0ABU6RXN7_9FABA|nr:hypothetical protein [Stylosanthes scabra]
MYALALKGKTSPKLLTVLSSSLTSQTVRCGRAVHGAVARSTKIAALTSYPRGRAVRPCGRVGIDGSRVGTYRSTQRKDYEYGGIWTPMTIYESPEHDMAIPMMNNLDITFFLVEVLASTIHRSSSSRRRLEGRIMGSLRIWHPPFRVQHPLHGLSPTPEDHIEGVRSTIRRLER